MLSTTGEDLISGTVGLQEAIGKYYRYTYPEAQSLK